MRELVAGCAAGKIDGKVVLDLSDIEDKQGEADLPVALMPKSHGKLIADGRFSDRRRIQTALDMSIDACRRIYEMQREALRQKYHIVKDEADNEAATEVRV